ncbi:MAG: hypothetical protein KGZ25_14445 [Planctomycetes bacterium]|nr:hypothetical protein [Planctomycetota bacterium]
MGYDSRNLLDGGTFGNGVTLSNTRDGLGRITERQYNTDSTLIVGFAYGYDEMGNKRTFFLLSVGALLSAIFLGFLSQWQSAGVAVEEAQRTEQNRRLRDSRPERSTDGDTGNKDVVKRYAMVSDTLRIASLCSLGLGLCFWIGAIVRKEKCFHSLLAILVVLYAFVFLLMV